MQTLETVALWIVAIIGIGCLILAAAALYFKVWDWILMALKLHGEFRAFVIDRARKRAEERSEQQRRLDMAKAYVDKHRLDPRRGVDD